jgi:hypothetical protein
LKQKPAVALALFSGPLLAVAYAVSSAEEVANPAVEAQKSETIQVDPLDEVIVNGHKIKLHELRKEIDKAEDAFYEAFNEVNTEPQYKTVCLDDIHTDARWHEHVCRPEFARRAQEDEAATWLGLYHAPPAVMVVDAKMPAYKKHMHDLVMQDPKLRKALGHYYALTQRYDSVFKEKRKGKWIGWD